MSARVTLNGINRVGFTNWKGCSRWMKLKVRIWSAEHTAWWRPGGHGYTRTESEAGVFDFMEAYRNTNHCGPEKKIIYYAVEPNRTAA